MAVSKERLDHGHDCEIEVFSNAIELRGVHHDGVVHNAMLVQQLTKYGQEVLAPLVSDQGVAVCSMGRGSKVQLEGLNCLALVQEQIYGGVVGGLVDECDVVLGSTVS
jgi:hypothetical protein